MLPRKSGFVLEKVGPKVNCGEWSVCYWATRRRRSVFSQKKCRSGILCGLSGGA